MRLIHLCFQLHLPYEMREFVGEPYFDTKVKFDRANEQIYQPFFALLERNIQKTANWRFSLAVSGVWLELAQKYDRDLIERLRKILKSGRVELVAEPFYRSLSFFYNKEEFTEQVRLHQSRLEDLFGVKGKIFAMPDYMYNNAIGKWAEDFGFVGVLAAESRRGLDWYSTNHVYEAVGCEYLRLLFQNRTLADKVRLASDEILAERTRDGETKIVFSAKRFQKLVELETMRGSLVNLYFDTAIFERWRGKNIIGFFDELIANWLEKPENKFVNAGGACLAETPQVEISVRETVDDKSREEISEDLDSRCALVCLKDFENQLPKRLNSRRQRIFAERLYRLCREITASEDEGLLEDFRRLTLVDFQEKAEILDGVNWAKILEDLKKRAAQAKKLQAVEISRTYTKKRDRGIDEDAAVKVSFGKKKTAEAERKPEAAEEIRVVRIEKSEAPREKKVQVIKVEGGGVIEEVAIKRVIPTRIIVDKPEIMLPESGKPKKEHKIKKIIKKLVIE